MQSNPKTVSEIVSESRKLEFTKTTTTTLFTHTLTILQNTYINRRRTEKNVYLRLETEVTRKHSSHPLMGLLWILREYRILKERVVYMV